MAVLRAGAIERNAATMAEFCRLHGVELVPHAKTTMSPELVALQLRHGATGMTAAVPWQAARLWEWGVGQVLVANEITDPDGLDGLLTRRTGGRSLWFYVDSLAGVDLAVAAVRRCGAAPAEVLLEVGHRGGRSGVREPAAALELARTVAARPELALVGVAGFEGTVGTRREPDVLERVDDFLGALGALLDRCVGEGLVSGTPIVTVGGSTFFDRVVEVLAPRARALDARLILRSGCYLTHDHGIYERTSPSGRDGWDLPVFLPAIEIWTRVVSRPEPGLALLNAGRRDLSHDAGLPVPLSRTGPDGRTRPVTGWRVTGLGDQHAFVELPAGDELRPGDLVALGISHPCTTFDKWAEFFVVDLDGTVTSTVHTEFA